MGRASRIYLVFGALLFLVLEILIALAIYWWPAFYKEMAAIRRLASPIPVFADSFDLIERFGVLGYVLGQQYFKSCNVAGAAAAVLFGMGAIAGEVQRGTFEAWIARPVSRVRLYTERWFMGLLALFLPVLGSSLTIPWLLERFAGSTMKYEHLILCSIHQTLFLGALYSITFMLSAFGSQPMKIAFGMLFFSIFQFALYMVKYATDYSAFRLSDIQTYARILMSSRLDTGVTAILVVTCVVTYGIGLAAFQRRTP